MVIWQSTLSARARISHPSTSALAAAGDYRICERKTRGKIARRTPVKKTFSKDVGVPQNEYRPPPVWLENSRVGDRTIRAGQVTAWHGVLYTLSFLWPITDITETNPGLFPLPPTLDMPDVAAEITLPDESFADVISKQEDVEQLDVDVVTGGINFEDEDRQAVGGVTTILVGVGLVQSHTIT
ncbi:hypothetical protein K438DRAFT_1747191 [Mycena galopus ATCC 62051]|nr:hypothetical protein K438DRAFT_1747191 [Mycena galopus ATCC 62051]